MDYLKDSHFQYSPETQDILPIDNETGLIEFYKLVSNRHTRSKGLMNAINGFRFMLYELRYPQADVSYAYNDEFSVFSVNANYYYKLYASLFTLKFHDELLDRATFFKTLRTKAVQSAAKRDAHLTDVQGASEEATQSWRKDSEHLKELYEMLRANRNHEYINLRDDNSTLLRQMQLVSDLHIRRNYNNEYLSITLIFLCLLILNGYLNHIGFSFALVSLMSIAIFVSLGIVIIVRMVNARKFHPLNFQQINFAGYPVVNEEIQAKYIAPNSSDDSQFKGPASKATSCA